MVACSIAIPLVVAKIVGDQGIALGQGISRFVNAPVSSLLGAAALTYLPNYFPILTWLHRHARDRDQSLR